MRAAIISIGDELTLGQNLDTNSAWIAAKLAERSILTIEQRTVADDRQAIAAASADLSRRVEVLVITGGLGPTEDDLTREALQDVIDPHGQPILDEAALQHIINRFQKRGLEMPAMNRKQALRPASMRCLPNPHGTAPGLAGVMQDCRVFALPGPPREMQPMFIDHVLPALQGAQPQDVVLTMTVHEIGMGESDAAQRLGSLMDRARNPLVGITVSDAIVSARLRATGPESIARAQMRATAEQIEQAWGPYAFARDSVSLAEAVGQLLRRAGRRLVTAESCTGGWLGKMIVDIPGSTDYYVGGWVTYSNQLKESELRVAPDLLSEFGAVSAPVACAMAEGALRASGADEALSITGIAGPARADQPSEKPVGTVFVGLARKSVNGIETTIRHFHFPGDRTTVRDRSVKAALQMLRFALMGVPHDVPLLWEATPQVKNPKIQMKESAR